MRNKERGLDYVNNIGRKGANFTITLYAIQELNGEEKKRPDHQAPKLETQKQTEIEATPFDAMA